MKKLSLVIAATFGTDTLIIKCWVALTLSIIYWNLGVKVKKLWIHRIKKGREKENMGVNAQNKWREIKIRKWSEKFVRKKKWKVSWKKGTKDLNREKVFKANRGRNKKYPVKRKK